MSELLKKFMKEESGATMVEYAIMVALIAIAVALVVWAIGSRINSVFQDVLNCLSSPSATTCTVH